MIFEFAISPTLCTNYKDLRFFLQTFGSSEGRLFSDIPRKKWMQLARQEIKASENGQVMKKRLVAAIDRLSRKALCRRNHAPDAGEKPWLDHAIAAHEDRPFKAILTGSYDGNEECIISCEQDFIDDSRWIVPLDSEVERTAVEMIQAIRPMLDCTREVVLIDRNFDPDKYRWRQFLTELAVFLSRRTFSPSIGKIDFHFGDDISVNQLQFLCTKHIAGELPAGMKVNFIVWPRDELHDRYVLTDVGGVRFGIGLDIWDGSGPDKVEVSRTSEETRLRWWALCKNKTAAFTIP
jgi:hypothetical protein